MKIIGLLSVGMVMGIALSSAYIVACKKNKIPSLCINDCCESTDK